MYLKFKVANFKLNAELPLAAVGAACQCVSASDAESTRQPLSLSGGARIDLKSPDLGSENLKY